MTEEIFTNFLMPTLFGYMLILIFPKLRLPVLAHNENGYKLIMRSIIIGLVFMLIMIIAVEMISVIITSNKTTELIQKVTTLNLGEEIIFIAENFIPFLLFVLESFILKPFKIMFSPKETPEPIHFLAATIFIVAFYTARKKFFTKSIRAQELKLEKDYLTDNGDIFMTKIVNAQKSGIPIMLTLKSKKVYIGFVDTRPRFLYNAGKKSLILWVIQSGYRDEKNLEYKPTNNYSFSFEIINQSKQIQKHFNKFKDDFKKAPPYPAKIDEQGTTKMLSYKSYENITKHTGVVVDWAEIDTLVTYDVNIREEKKSLIKEQKAA